MFNLILSTTTTTTTIEEIRKEIDSLSDEDLRKLYDLYKSQQPPTPPSPTGKPPAPTEGRAQPEKGGNQDPDIWTIGVMRNDPTKYKIIDNKSINIADGFSSVAKAQEYITYYKWLKANPDTTPPPPKPPEPPSGGGGTPVSGNLRIYKPKDGGAVLTNAVESGGQGATDGIRYNISNPNRIVNRESTFYGIISKVGPGDKLHVSPKIGSHGKTGEPCGLLECSIDYSGGKARLRTEGPHPSYHSCGSNGTVGNVPKIPIGSEIAFKTAQWLTTGNGNNDNSMIEFYYSFDGTDSKNNKFNWIKYGSLAYPANSPPCAIPLVKGGKIAGTAKAQDTMRMNSAFTPAPWKGEIVEIDVQNGIPTPIDPATHARISEAKLIPHKARNRQDADEKCDE